MKTFEEKAEEIINEGCRCKRNLSDCRDCRYTATKEALKSVEEETRKEDIKIVKQVEEQDFFVCENHSATGGYEACCACSGERLCTEAGVDSEIVEALTSKLEGKE